MQSITAQRTCSVTFNNPTVMQTNRLTMQEAGSALRPLMAPPTTSPLESSYFNTGKEPGNPLTHLSWFQQILCRMDSLAILVGLAPLVMVRHLLGRIRLLQSLRRGRSHHSG